MVNIKENVQSGSLSALHHAVIHGHLMAAEILLGAGADMNAQDDVGFTPLHHACRRGYVKMAELLLSSGADPVKPDLDGKPPSYVAKIFHHHHIVKLLPKDEKGYDFQSWLCNEIENNPIVSTNRIFFAQNKKGKKKGKGKKKK